MLRYWIWLAELQNLLPWQKKALVQQFGSPDNLYGAEAAMLECLPEKVRKALENRDLTRAEHILRECEKKNIRILTYNDESYSQLLKNIGDPPMVLYYRGILPSWEERPWVGVVGTRKATTYGRDLSRRLGAEICRCGGGVISGGAGGIDAQAMEGALEEGGAVTGVLGCGVDVIYPRTHRRLFNRICEEGCLISEYAPSEPPLGWHFLQRNRIISGLAQGILVVEAPARSGALNTAHHAYEQGKDLFAVPANVGNMSAEGSNALLSEGALAVRNGWDLMKIYQLSFPNQVENRISAPADGDSAAQLKVAQNPVIPVPAGKIGIDNPQQSSYSVINSGAETLSEEEKTVLSLVSRRPIHPDQVAEEIDLPPHKVQSILTKLTVKGYLLPHPGGLVSLK